MNIKNFKLNPNNPRVINDQNFKKLVKSIKDFPEMLEKRPIVCVYDEELKLIPLWWNQRLKALMELWYEDIPETYYSIVDDWDEEKQREFIIKDNNNLWEWDYNELQNEWNIEDLQEWWVNLDFWEDEEKEVVEDDFVAKEKDEKEIKVKLWDIYELWNHRLMCWDSTSIDDVNKLMNWEKADMVFTDPPYGYEYQSNMRTKTEKFDVIENDDKKLDFMPIVKKFNNGFVFVCTTWKVLKEWLEIFTKYYDLSNMIIWDKGGGGIGDLKHTFLTDYEIILCSNNDKQITGKRIGSVWNIQKDNANDYVHATQKPVEVSATAIQNTTNENDNILDLFGGSGSTLIACEQLNRKCYMMELDPHYIDVIIQRWENFTGEKAVKI